MISAFFLIPAFLVGSMFGGILAAILYASRD